MQYKRGEHPNSKKNLEKGKFKKGEVSNPKGRPRKELCITSILREKLNEPCDKDPSKTWAEWLALRALELAGENPTYYKELLDRVEGKVTQPIGSAPDMPIITEIVAHITEDSKAGEPY
ncbi:MAG: hypothetical protein ACOC7P_01130 [Chloroflexota bacterium]